MRGRCLCDAPGEAERVTGCVDPGDASGRADPTSSVEREEAGSRCDVQDVQPGFERGAVHEGRRDAMEDFGLVIGRTAPVEVRSGRLTRGAGCWTSVHGEIHLLDRLSEM